MLIREKVRLEAFPNSLPIPVSLRFMQHLGRLSFKKITKGKFTGWMREDLFEILPSPFFEDPISFVHRVGGQMIKESRLRFAAVFPVAGGNAIFLKRDQTKGLLRALKLLILPSKGRKEWFVARQSGKRNLNVPKPLGWMERVHHGFVRESYYLSEAIESGVSLAERADILKDQKISQKLAKTVLRIHRSGLYHRDFHAGNFLWDGESFFLIDLHRANLLHSISLRQKLWNLSYLFHSLRPVWEEKDHLRFLGWYLGEDSVPSEKIEGYLRSIHLLMDRLQKRQWKSRTRRCLKESTEFSIRKEKGRTVYHRRDFPFDRLKRVIQRHLVLIKEDPSALKKQSSHINVSLFDDEGVKICVKQFCYPTLKDRMKDALRLSRGLKSWIGGNGLKARGMPSVQSFGFLERKSLFGPRGSFLIMGVPRNACEISRYLSDRFGDVQKKRQFIEAFAQWLAGLHEKNIYHLDMKTSNILISDVHQTLEFYLLDLQDVRLDRKLNEKMLFKNLLQLNTSAPDMLTRTDRFRFFKAYQGRHTIVKDEKRFLRDLLRKSEERGFIHSPTHGRDGR